MLVRYPKPATLTHERNSSPISVNMEVRKYSAEGGTTFKLYPHRHVWESSWSEVSHSQYPILGSQMIPVGKSNQLHYLIQLDYCSPIKLRFLTEYAYIMHLGQVISHD